VTTGVALSAFCVPGAGKTVTLRRVDTIFSGMASRSGFIPTAEWEDRRQLRGLAGERAAIGYLTSCGWDIEAHRFRLGRHDLDLVVRRGDLVAFVEVKARRSTVCGSAVESVSRLKQRLLAKVALLWRVRYGRAGDRYRFDLIAIEDLGRGKYRLEHVEDAWRLDWSPG
jgi:putative endonuclease